MRSRSVSFIAIGLSLYSVGVFGSDAEFLKLSAARAPVIGQGHGLAVAVVFPGNSTVQLVVRAAHAKEVHSQRFQIATDANYGAVWVEQVEITSPSQFVVFLRSRETCGPGVYDYVFSKREGGWFVAGLERSETMCSARGIAPSWRKSYNFLAGRIESTNFDRETRRRSTRSSRTFPPFPLEEWEPFASKYEE
jgi:hypothetical protein